jgi:hypothetical protein
MTRLGSSRLLFTMSAVAVVLVICTPSLAATKTLDLDAQTGNGAESQCDLNVLGTFPVNIENKVTNKAIGDAFTFSWKSAGPGGFTSSVTTGSTGGVGAKWTWTTNQTVYSYTGTTCDNDVCFSKTGGPDAMTGTCSLACLNDGAVLTIQKGAAAGEVDLSWTGGQGPYTIYRSGTAIAVTDPANSVATTAVFQYADFPPAGSNAFYVVRASTCLQQKACSTSADCSLPTDGSCISRGPFSVPGRSLYTTDVTVSAASLTSSLITFFSPPKEVFRVTSSVAPGGSGVAYQQALTNSSTQPVTVDVAAYPPGCCTLPHQINCQGTCFSYLTDNNNCGGCGIVCGLDTICSEGACVRSCHEGSTDCGSVCADLQNDPQNCGVCDVVCASDICSGLDCFQSGICTGGACVACEAPTDHACNNQCVDINSDVNNCGGCGVSCNTACGNSGGNSCSEGACYCNSDRGFTPPAAPIASTTVTEAPICQSPPSETVIPPGGTSTDCLLSGVLAKEVPTSVLVCGSGIPDGQARCPNGDPASQGTFMKLVPDPTKPIGAAYVTPYGVHVTEPSNDGLIEPGETVSLLIDVLNAGPSTISNAKATIVSPPVDLTDDGVNNPISVTLSTSQVSFGTILGTTPSGTDCTTPAVLHPVTNTTPFQLTVPTSHPGDTSRGFVLKFTGTVGGSPFAMDVPLALGIADKCDATKHTRDFDGIDGLFSPMAKLVPVGEKVPSPSQAFTAGQMRQLILRQKCGSTNLTGTDVDAPEIVSLTEATRGAIDLSTLYEEHHHTHTVSFIWEDSDDDLSDSENHWEYNLGTSNLGKGTFTLTIRIASRKLYVTGFVLQ